MTQNNKSRVVLLELKARPIGGKSELITCFHEFEPPAICLILPVAGLKK